METIVILLTGFLFTCGLYLILRRNITRMLIGLVFLSQAANLVILTLPGLGTGISPIVREGASSPPPGHPDPLPLELILSAIVIGFGVIAFTIVLVKKTYHDLQTDDLDRLKKTDA
jgi:multicomponent Na+:H+ antiporter subunit C